MPNYCPRCGLSVSQYYEELHACDRCYGKQKEHRYYCYVCECGYDEGVFCPWCGRLRKMDYNRLPRPASDAIDMRNGFRLFFPVLLFVLFCIFVAPALVSYTGIGSLYLYALLYSLGLLVSVYLSIGLSQFLSICGLSKHISSPFGLCFFTILCVFLAPVLVLLFSIVR